MRFFIASVVVGATLLCIAASPGRTDPPAKPAVPPQCIMTVELWRKPQKGDEVLAAPRRVENKPLPYGEPVWVQATLRNRGTKTVIFEDLAEFEFEVRDEQGHRVAQTALSKLLEERRSMPHFRRVRDMVEPGAAKKRCVQISALFDMSRPGIYYIVASRAQPFVDDVVSKRFRIEIGETRAVLNPDLDEEAMAPVKAE